MSESDSFINEVSEELRRDRLFRLFRKYAWILVVAVAIIVGGTAWNEWSKARSAAAAQAAGDALNAALAAGDPALLADLAAGTADAAPAAALLRATLLAESGETTEALAVLQGVSADARLPAFWRDLALLRIVMLDGGNMARVDLDTALDQLTAPGAPYRMLALEQRALVHLRAGETEATLALLAQIIAAEDATQDIRARAQELRQALGGADTDDA